MNFKSKLICGAAIVALSAFSSAAIAAEVNATNQSDANIAASKAGTEIEKAVGAGDTFTKAELESRVGLDDVANPAQTLASAKVDDLAGNIIGPVKSVVMDNKEVESIHVNVGGWLGINDRTVAIDADHFTYIPSRNILITSLSKAHVEKMGAAKAE